MALGCVTPDQTIKCKSLYPAHPPPVPKRESRVKPRTFVIVSILALTIAACGDRGVSAVRSEDDQAAQATNGFEEAKVAADASSAGFGNAQRALAATPGEPKPVGGD